MSIQNYNANTLELTSQAQVPPEVIFNYEFSPYIDLFDHFFEFCRENLLIHDQQFNIRPARFFYENERIEVNARAMTMEGYSLIMMTAAMQIGLYDLFYQNNNCFDRDQVLNERYHPIFNGADPVGYIMYQVSIQFTYYHELAHLIQRSALLPIKLNEKYPAVAGNYDLHRHLLEFDADCHAANFIFFHIMDYINQHSSMAGDVDAVQTVIALFAATIFIYFTFLDGGGPIYYNLGNHPHPLIRIIYITNLIVETARLNMDQMALDRVAIVREAFDTSARFYVANGMVNHIEHFDTIFEQEYPQIADYIVFLSNTSEQYPELTRNRFDANGNPL